MNNSVGVHTCVMVPGKDGCSSNVRGTCQRDYKKRMNVWRLFCPVRSSLGGGGRALDELEFTIFTNIQ